MMKKEEEQWLRDRLASRSGATQEAEIRELEAEKDLEHFRRTGHMSRDARKEFRKTAGGDRRGR